MTITYAIQFLWKFFKFNLILFTKAPAGQGRCVHISKAPYCFHSTTEYNVGPLWLVQHNISNRCVPSCKYGAKSTVLERGCSATYWCMTSPASFSQEQNSNNKAYITWLLGGLMNNLYLKRDIDNKFYHVGVRSTVITIRLLEYKIHLSFLLAVFI